MNQNGTDVKIIQNHIQRLTNQIYKLLPQWEEGEDWKTPLETIFLEFSGMQSMLNNQSECLFSLLCKLKGMSTLTQKDFSLFRRTIFECLSLCNKLKGEIENELI